eukprot:scaffold40984_cov36-Tisochrysis_lutea.AAC.2
MRLVLTQVRYPVSFRHMVEPICPFGLFCQDMGCRLRRNTRCLLCCVDGAAGVLVVLLAVDAVCCGGSRRALSAFYQKQWVLLHHLSVHVAVLMPSEFRSLLVLRFYFVRAGALAAPQAQHHRVAILSCSDWGAFSASRRIGKIAKLLMPRLQCCTFTAAVVSLYSRSH